MNSELTKAYDAVFDENGQIKTCGRTACINLIVLMRNYTTEDVGDEVTGKIKIEAMKAEYSKICGKME